MSKMLKTIALLLVIAAVVSAAGCAGKTPTPANNSTAAPEHVATVTPTTPVETPTETPAVTPAETNNATENATVNTTAQTGTHMSNAQRKLAIAQNRT
jgi:ABC-type glycerol-3-phosphate transport system substrate-binding protein